jgi:hypothetical protein
MSHTIIVALAVTLSDTSTPSFPAFESIPDVDAEHVAVVAVQDRRNPVNNNNPAVFSSWPEEKKNIEAAKAEAGVEMEHAP